MKTTLDQRDASKWCEFQDDHGHQTEDCITLKFEVSELLKRGHLKDFLTDKGKGTMAQSQQLQDKREVTLIEPSCHDRTINVITRR